MISFDSVAIRYIIGDATRPIGSGPRIIAHVCNDLGGWGAGFVRALSRRWPDPEEKYRAWFAGRIPNADPPALGMIQLVQVEDELWVANMIAQHGYRNPENPRPLRDDALETCLDKLSQAALRRKASVHMPRIGCGLAGGRWEEVEPIIQRTLVKNGVLVIVYDFNPA